MFRSFHKRVGNDFGDFLFVSYRIGWNFSRDSKSFPLLKRQKNKRIRIGSSEGSSTDLYITLNVYSLTFSQCLKKISINSSEKKIYESESNFNVNNSYQDVNGHSHKQRKKVNKTHYGCMTIIFSHT